MKIPKMKPASKWKPSPEQKEFRKIVLELKKIILDAKLNSIEKIDFRKNPHREFKNRVKKQQAEIIKRQKSFDRNQLYAVIKK